MGPVDGLHQISNNFRYLAEMSSFLPSTILHIYVCCGSGQARSGGPAGLSCSVQMLLCLPRLLGTDQSACPSVFLLCVCVYTYLCVCVSRHEWFCRMPALPRAAQLHTTGETWHKETTERARERVCLCLRACVHFLNAPLTAVVYERGLVLEEQMAEC